MHRRQFLKTIGLSAIAGSTLIGCTNKKKPNFLFILVDDLGWADLGCYGSTFYETSHLDKLAESGMRFTDAYAACPVCSPTRAAIMTGRHPVRVDITDWIPGNDPKNRKLLGPQDKHELPLAETTIAEVLKDNGYNTFFAGKWHLGNEGYFPENHYDDEYATEFSGAYNKKHSDPVDNFSPVMVPLSKQDELLGGYLTMIDSMVSIVVSVFIIAMAIVLWNAGLLGGLRRYGEMGLRMAIGEHKSQ